MRDRQILPVDRQKIPDKALNNNKKIPPEFLSHVVQ